MRFCDFVVEKVGLELVIRERALELETIGFDTYDALHIACAEKAEVDVFLTTDDKLLRKSLREREKIRVEVANPLKWLIEIGD